MHERGYREKAPFHASCDQIVWVDRPVIDVCFVLLGVLQGDRVVCECGRQGYCIRCVVGRVVCLCGCGSISTWQQCYYMSRRALQQVI